MRCRECGNDIADKASRCPYCGASVVRERTRGKSVEIFFVAAVILVLAVASFLFFRVKTNESASLDEVKNTFYRNLPIGAIYSSVLSDAEWNVGRNGVVSVEGNVVYGNHLATLTASYDTASTVVLRSLMIDGSLVSIDSVSAVMDRFYDMAYSSRR